MDQRPTTSDIEARARRRVGMRLGFYTHALVFVLVNLGLFVFNSVIGGYRWSVWPLAGWGLGLAIHGLVVLLSRHGEGWRDRMLAQEIEHLKRTRE
jgi:hypothetical protein